LRPPAPHLADVADSVPAKIEPLFAGYPRGLDVREFPPNHYEVAFENWLKDHRVRYGRVAESKRAAISNRTTKTPDFLVHSSDGRKLIVEVKGRKYRGTKPAKLTGFESWVTADDVDGLADWQDALGAEGLLVFAYDIEKVDLDFDGRDTYEYAGRRYLFFGVSLEDYRRHMKLRSPKWRTVTLGSRAFRRCAASIDELLL